MYHCPHNDDILAGDTCSGGQETSDRAGSRVGEGAVLGRLSGHSDQQVHGGQETAGRCGGKKEGLRGNREGAKCVMALKYLLASYLKVRVSERRRVSIHWFTPQRTAEARSLELRPISHGRAGTQALGYLLLRS